MPIKPENKSRYPKNWKEIRERILKTLALVWILRQEFFRSIRGSLIMQIWTK